MDTEARDTAEATALLSDVVEKARAVPIGSLGSEGERLRQSLSRAESFLEERETPSQRERGRDAMRADEALHMLRQVHETLSWGLSEVLEPDDTLRPYLLFWKGQISHTLSRLDPDWGGGVKLQGLYFLQSMINKPCPNNSSSFYARHFTPQHTRHFTPQYNRGP